jgi:hypothetical protein
LHLFFSRHFAVLSLLLPYDHVTAVAINELFFKALFAKVELIGAVGDFSCQKITATITVISIFAKHCILLPFSAAFLPAAVGEISGQPVFLTRPGCRQAGEEG